MKTYQKIIIGLFLFMLPFFLVQTARATEGIIEMTNPSQPSVRCYALSVFNKDNTFNVLVTCRNLIYPPTTYDLYYVLWASPLGQGDDILLGDMAPGKLFTKTKTQFDTLYVTREKSPKVKTPSNQIVVSGTVQPVAYLEGAATLPQITPTQAPAEGGQVTPAPTQTENQASQQEEKEGRDLIPFGSTAFIIVGGLIGLIFLLYVVLRKG